MCDMDYSELDDGYDESDDLCEAEELDESDSLELLDEEADIAWEDEEALEDWDQDSELSEEIQEQEELEEKVEGALEQLYTRLSDEEREQFDESFHSEQLKEMMDSWTGKTQEDILFDMYCMATTPLDEAGSDDGCKVKRR